MSNSIDLNKFLSSRSAYWYWSLLLIGGIGVLLFYLPSVAAFTFLRAVINSCYLLFIPGFSIVRAVFPHSPTRHRGLDQIEQFLLSIGLSLALTTIIGLLVNYSLWGISVATRFILLGITILFSTIGIIREYWLFQQYSGEPEIRT